MKRRKLSVKKITIFMIILIIIISLIYLVLGEKKSEKKPKVIDEINGYVLSDVKSSYYKNLFNELKVELNKDEINEENYAILIAKLFITDFFSLHYSLNKNDIGGVQYVYEDFRTDFSLYAKNSIYNVVENNIYGDRKQELPIVSNIEINDISNDTFEYYEKKDDGAYVIKLKIIYEKDLDYQNEATIVLIHNNKKLEVAELK